MEIFRLLEAGRLHFAVSPEGRHFICPNSLALERATDVVEGAGNSFNKLT